MRIETILNQINFMNSSLVLATSKEQAESIVKVAVQQIKHDLSKIDSRNVIYREVKTNTAGTIERYTLEDGTYSVIISITEKSIEVRNLLTELDTVVKSFW